MKLYQIPMFDQAEQFQNGKLSGLITEYGKSFLSSGFTANDLDQWMKNGISLKDSPTTTASLVNIPGTDMTVFLKRNNNKGPRFTCRYLFRSARVFHAAKAAAVFEALNIKTPRVCMAAEKKTGLYLHAGYIMTEALTHAKPLHELLYESNCEEEILKVFLPWAVKKLVKLHRAGIIHGDLKLINFYCDGDWKTPEESFGIWDLDSVSIQKKPLPQEVEREISRIFFSLGMIPGEQDRQLIETEQKVRDFCQQYHDLAPDIYQPVPENIMAFINKRTARLRKKPYSGMKKGTF